MISKVKGMLAKVKKRSDVISFRQYMMLMSIAMMSPAVRIMLTRTSKIAGTAGWLAPIAALIPTVILLYIESDLLKEDGTNLTDIFTRVLGQVGGRIFSAIYGLWFLVLTSSLTRTFAERFLSTTFKLVSIQVFIVLLLVVVLYASRKRLEVLARANQVFFWIFGIILVVFLWFSAVNVKSDNLLPVSYLDAWPATKAAVPVMGIFCTRAFSGFLFDSVSREDSNIKKTSFIWTLGLSALLLVFQILGYGNFGAQMISRMQAPFFMMIKGIKVLNTFERMESLMIALWMITDFVAITLYIMGAGRALKSAFNLKDEKNNIVIPLVIIIFICSFLIGSNAFDVYKFSEKVIQPVNIILTYGALPVIWVIDKCRQRLKDGRKKEIRKSEKNTLDKG